MENCKLQLTGYDDNNDIRVSHDTDGHDKIYGDELSFLI